MKTIRIGKHSSNDYVVSEDTVSRYHAQMTITDSGEVFIKDLGSTNGTFVDGKKISSDAKLIAGNVVRLGNKVINWQEISQKQSNATKVYSHATSVSGSRQYLIGRDEKCQIKFSQAEVSSRHAMLEKNPNGAPQITDLGSTNGTFVNGQRIFSTTELKKGDIVLLANKYALNWEQYIPTSCTPKTSRGFNWGIVAAAIATIVILGCGIFYYVQNRVWTPEKIYSTYKNSVVYIYAHVHYAPYYHGIPLSELDKDLFGAYHIEELSVVRGTTGWSGTGSFVSADGLIVTNRHVANMVAEEDARNKEKIKKQVKSDLVLLFEQLNTAYNNTRKASLRKQYAETRDIVATIYRTDEEIEIKLEYDFLGIACNDTHYSDLNDMMPCTFIRNHPDENVDAALIQLNSKKTPENVTIVDIQNFSRPEDRKIGSKIYTIGFPKGELLGKTDSGLEANNQSGEVTQEQGNVTFGHNIVTQRGASGSPIFDSHGRFAGLVASGWSFGGTPTGYNGAVRPERVSELIK